jgi:hypothetical protein
VPKEGAPPIRYRLAREAAGEVALPAHAETFLEGLRLSPEIAASLAPPTIENRPLVEFASQPERVYAAILQSRKEHQLSQDTANKIEQPRLKLLTERTHRALAALSKINATLTQLDTVLIPGTQAAFTLTLTNQGRDAATIKGAQFNNWRESVNVEFPSTLAPGATIKRSVSILVPKNAGINLPRAAHLYDELLFGQQVTALINVSVKDESFSLPVYAQADVAPIVEIARLSPSPLVLTPGNINQPKIFTFNIVNHRRTPFAGRAGSGNAQDRSSSSNITFRLSPNESRNIRLSIPGNVVGQLAYGAMRPSSPPLPKAIPLAIYTARTNELIARATIPLVYSDARVPASLRVGYVRSFDDTLRHALEALGVEAKELTIDEVQAGDLKRYDTIIIDNRGYQAHPELVAANARLLEYASAGGTLIVFYHKTGEWNPDPKKKRPQLAPYSIVLDSSRVTDETAPVVFTEPQSALLNFPNKIEQQDFNGWIQERGLYYPKEWDARYSAPFATNDAGEAVLRGGLLATTYGRGRYIYTSMVWYRQLRAGVPGAYRMFANMISYGHAGTTTGITRVR